MIRPLRIALFVLLGLGVLLAIATFLSLEPLPARLTPDSAELKRVQVRDRRGIPLSVTYENDWNLHDLVELEAIPPLLRQAFVMAEDQRFYNHYGPDWSARLHAAWQNLRARRAVRGASTISEQTVRMLHPRPRTLWSRWLEGWEAGRRSRWSGASARSRSSNFTSTRSPIAGGGAGWRRRRGPGLIATSPPSPLRRSSLWR
jgi:penicillin-binding protein 1C